MSFFVSNYNILQFPCEDSTIFRNILHFRLFFNKNKLTKKKVENRKLRDKNKKVGVVILPQLSNFK